MTSHEDEYIDCNPVSIFGDVEVTEKDNTIDANTYSAEMLESAIQNYDN